MFIIHQIYLQLGQEMDGVRFLGPKALWVDSCVKIFFFMTIWQAGYELVRTS